MKKFFLFIGLMIAGFTAFSQDIRFTKGDVAPGKLKNGGEFENFIIGKIAVKDAEGVAYTFVKADFEMKNTAGKLIKYTINALNFTQAQTEAILAAGRDGAEYTFLKIVVKDKNGKEITLPAVEFIYDTYFKG